MYVEDLVAPHTVNTMPEATLDVDRRPRSRSAATRSRTTTTGPARSWPRSRTAGVDYDDVVRVLEDEGVEKFETSWNELLDTIKTELEDKA